MQRNYIKKLLALPSLLFCLAACASSTVPAANLPPEAKKVGVIISIPAQIRLVSGGILRTTTMDMVDATDWHLDDVAFDAASEVLAPRFETTRLTPDRPIKDFTNPLNSAVFGTYIEKEVREVLHDGRPQDLYLVISLGEHAHPYNGASPMLRDVGVSQYYAPAGSGIPQLHTFLQVNLLDGKTKKLIVSSPLRKPAAGSRGSSATGDLPTQDLSEITWGDYWYQFSTVDQQRLRNDLTDLLSQTVGFTVAAMFHQPMR